jgi:hypothetical protein
MLSRKEQVGAGAAGAELQRERCHVDGRAATKCSACVSGADGAFGASAMPISHLAMRDQARILANAVAQRAAWALALPALSYSVSVPYRWVGGTQNAAHAILVQMGRLEHRRCQPAVWRCETKLGYWQMLRKEQCGRWRNF